MLLFFGLAESALRLLKYRSEDFSIWMRFNNPHRDDSSMQRDPQLFWRFRCDGSAGMKINEQGLRGEETSVSKPAGVFRVLCLGDSSTFGCNVPLKQTYPYLLERLLRQRNPQRSIEVLNAGVPGYSSYQGMRALETWLADYQPDLVVAYFGIHDTAQAVLVADKAQRELAASGVWLDRLLERSVGYQFLAKLVRRTRGLEPGLILGDENQPKRVSPQDYLDNHALMAELAQSWGGSLLVMPAVSITESGQCRLHVEHPEQLKQRFDVLDLCPLLVEQRPPLELFDPGGVHPTPEGYRIYAQALFDRL